jgi:hypothetical protein
MGREIFLFGSDRERVPIAMSYDTVRDAWQVRSSPRRGSMWPAAAVVDGKVLLIGKGASDMEIYDPTSDAWTMRKCDAWKSGWLRFAATII